jgi:hypothetical protein
MGYRIMQVALYVLGAVFALAACKGFTEPWRQMDSILASERAAGYLIAIVLATICVVAAQQFGQMARRAKDSE